MRREECSHADRPRLGSSHRSAHDPMRIGQALTLSFSGGVELKAYARTSGHEPARLTLSSGLLGTDGPMPLHLTEYVWVRAAHHGDGAWAAFLDIFHHRMACLLYRAWATGQPVVSRDRPHDDAFARYVGSLCGLAHGAFDPRIPTDADALQFCALLADRRRHPAGLAALLAHYFGLPVSITPFIGQWLTVPAGERARLSRRRTSPLGRGQVLGGRVWDRQHTFRVVLGPVDFAAAMHMQPGTDAFRQLARWVGFYTGNMYGWELELQLLADTVPPLRLDATARLSRSAWLGKPRTAATTSIRFAAPVASRAAT
jgi:type VI secretion system protein ImpH